MFGKKLRELVDRRGLTMYRLAQLTGISVQGVTRLETEGRDPSWTTVQKICLALRVDCREFYDPAITLPDPGAARGRGRPARRAKGRKGGGK